jgi:hypothetical protein
MKELIIISFTTAFLSLIWLLVYTIYGIIKRIKDRKEEAN